MIRSLSSGTGAADASRSSRRVHGLFFIGLLAIFLISLPSQVEAQRLWKRKNAEGLLIAADDMVFVSYNNVTISRLFVRMQALVQSNALLREDVKVSFEFRGRIREK